MNIDPSPAGILYVVATPIGNLQDITLRALEVLRSVAAIAAEDTRHSRKLLGHYGIAASLLSLHEHNERTVSATVLQRLQAGESLALISDAGTPLISDPGFHLISAAREAGLRVVPVPGPSALVAALSVAGLPTDRFCFEGFLPARQAARRQRLQALRDATATLVFYESSHRIVAFLEDMHELFGAGRPAVLARELTKSFETIRHGGLGELAAWVAADSNQQKGEFVVLVQGESNARPDAPDAQAQRVLALLLAELPLAQAASLAAKITGVPKKQLYEHGLALKQ